MYLTISIKMLENDRYKQRNSLNTSNLGDSITLNLIHLTYLFMIRPDAFTKASGGFVVPYTEAIWALFPSICMTSTILTLFTLAIAAKKWQSKITIRIIHQYPPHRKLQRLMLENPHLSLCKVAEQSGFRSQPTFLKAFQEVMDCLPSEVKKDYEEK